MRFVKVLFGRAFFFTIVNHLKCKIEANLSHRQITSLIEFVVLHRL